MSVNDTVDHRAGLTGGTGPVAQHGEEALPEPTAERPADLVTDGDLRAYDVIELALAGHRTTPEVICERATPRDPHNPRRLRIWIANSRERLSILSRVRGLALPIKV